MNAVTQFAADMSSVGDKLVVKFDFQLAQNVISDQGNDFRFSLFDTDAGGSGAQMIRLGNQDNITFNNSMKKVRMDPAIDPFNSAGGSIGGAVYAPNNPPGSAGYGLPLWNANDVHTFTTTVERLTASTLSFDWQWENSAGSTSMGFTYNENTGAGANGSSDIWPGGLQKFNGFALTIFQSDPFDVDGLGGSGTISSFSVTGTPFSVPEPSSAALLAIMGCCTGTRRRRRV